MLMVWTLKTIAFLTYFCLSARIIDASRFISYETSSRFSHWLYGYSSQDNFDDLWFFADVAISLMAAVVLYFMTMMLIVKIRKK
ncbi:hypothetical protein IAH82_002927 [Escherichia coli]|nr:hypothetical protein [Escherichia coli]